MPSFTSILLLAGATASMARIPDQASRGSFGIVTSLASAEAVPTTLETLYKREANMPTFSISTPTSGVEPTSTPQPVLDAIARLQQIEREREQVEGELHHCQDKLPSLNARLEHLMTVRESAREDLERIMQEATNPSMAANASAVAEATATCGAYPLRHCM